MPNKFELDHNITETKMFAVQKVKMYLITVQ